MIKLFFMMVKKVIISVLFIYAYNKLALPLNVIIPINIVTVCLIAICGIPSIFMMILFSLVCI